MKRLIIPLFFTQLFLAGCASIDLNKVDIDELTVKLDATQSFDSTTVDVYMYRGFWQQPVKANDAQLTAYLANGETLTLRETNEKGRYGFRASDPVEVTRIEIETVGEAVIPFITPLFIDGIGAFEGGTYFKDDVLSLLLEESYGDKRYLVATATCGGAKYTSSQPLSSRAIDLEIRLGDIMNRINRAAEADLAGIIPVTLAIEEHYLPVWTPPFKVGTLAAREESNIQIDTSGFRFKATVGIRVSDGFLMSFSNNALPTRFCF